jgi:hypothetical protein
MSLTNFEKQKSVFQNAIEDIKDRFDALITDEVELVFDNNAFIYPGVLKVVYESDSYLVPEIVIEKPLATERSRTIVAKVIENFTEISDKIKSYCMMLNHIKHDFASVAETDECIDKTIAELKSIIESPEFDVDTFKVYIKSEGKFDYYLSIENIGATTKMHVDMAYIEVDTETQKQQKIFHYSIVKHEFLKDTAHQIVTGVCTHIA